MISRPDIFRWHEMGRRVTSGISAKQTCGGFSFASVLLDNDDLNQALENKNVVESEERTFGKYEGVYLKYNNLKTEKVHLTKESISFCQINTV